MKRDQSVNNRLSVMMSDTVQSVPDATHPPIIIIIIIIRVIDCHNINKSTSDDLIYKRSSPSDIT